MGQAFSSLCSQSDPLRVNPVSALWRHPSTGPAPTSRAKLVRKGRGRTAASPARVVDYPSIDGPGTRTDENLRRIARNAARARAAAQARATAQAALQQKLADFMARTAGRGMGAMPGMPDMAPLPAPPGLGRGADRMAPAAQMAMASALEPAVAARPAQAVPWRASAVARGLAMEYATPTRSSQAVPWRASAAARALAMPTADLSADLEAGAQEARAAVAEREREAAASAAEARRQRQAEADRATVAELERAGFKTGVLWREGVDPTALETQRSMPTQGPTVTPPQSPMPDIATLAGALLADEARRTAASTVGPVPTRTMARIRSRSSHI